MILFVNLILRFANST